MIYNILYTGPFDLGNFSSYGDKYLKNIYLDIADDKICDVKLITIKCNNQIIFMTNNLVIKMKRDMCNDQMNRISLCIPNKIPLLSTTIFELELYDNISIKLIIEIDEIKINKFNLMITTNQIECIKLNTCHQLKSSGLVKYFIIILNNKINYVKLSCNNIIKEYDNITSTISSYYYFNKILPSNYFLIHFGECGMNFDLLDSDIKIDSEYDDNIYLFSEPLNVEIYENKNYLLAYRCNNIFDII